MTDNQRLFDVFEHLKKEGKIKTYVELAEILGTNAAGINDLRTEKKKVSVSTLKIMKNSYPELNSEWLLTGKGSMLAQANDPVDNSRLLYLEQRIKDLEDALNDKKKIIALLEDQLAQHKSTHIAKHPTPK